MKHNSLLTPTVLGLFLLLTFGQPSAPTLLVSSKSNPSQFTLGNPGTQYAQILDGLVSWWPAEGNADDVENGNHGILENGATIVTCQGGQAFSFDGAPFIVPFPSVTIPNDPSLNPGSSSFSIEFWERAFSPNTFSHFLIKHQFDEDPLKRIRWSVTLNTINTARYVLQDGAGGEAIFDGSINITDGMWHHVAMVVDRDENIVRAFVDGQPDNEANWPDISNLGPINPEVELFLGAFFDGYLDEVAYYNRPLSELEVQSIFNAGNAGKCQFSEIEIVLGEPGVPLPINCRNINGVITVVIPSTNNFDATNIDHTTVRFGATGTEAAETHVKNKTGESKRHEADVDSDGDIDLIFHFRFGQTGIQCGDVEARLSGKTFDGQAIEGFGAIQTVGN